MKKLRKIFIILLTLCLISGETGTFSYRVYAEENYEILNTGFVEPTEYILPEDIADEIIYTPQSITLYSSAEADYWEQFTDDYYYSLLDSDGQSFWCEMNNCCLEIMNGGGTITEYDSSFYLTQAVYFGESINALLLWKMFVYSHPQYYFIANSYFVSTKNTMSLVIYQDFYDTDARNEATYAFKEQIETWRDEITESRPEKIEKQIHDILCSNVSYDYDNVNAAINQSAYSTFINKETVCAGYAKGFQLLCSGAGLEVVPVIGTANGGGHAWNKINLYGYWYVVDVTWDDQSHIRYDYYNKSDNATSEHVEDESLADYIPESEYSSTASSADNYIDAYFTYNSKEYFSVSGTNPYLALYIGNDSEAVVPETVMHSSNEYEVINNSGVEDVEIITGTIGEAVDGSEGLSYTYDSSTNILTITGEGKLPELSTNIVKLISEDIFVDEIKFVDCKIIGSMANAFSKCNTSNIDLKGLDTSQVTDMSFMFHWCSDLTSLDVSSLNTSQVTKMTGMFWNCYNLTSLNVGGLDTSQVTDMYGMFYNCRGLTSLDISSFDTSQVTDMYSMFSYCVGLTSLDISSFDTSQVRNMDYMFLGCSGLTSIKTPKAMNDVAISLPDTFYDSDMYEGSGKYRTTTEVSSSFLNTTLKKADGSIDDTGNGDSDGSDETDNNNDNDNADADGSGDNSGSTDIDDSTGSDDAASDDATPDDAVSDDATPDDTIPSDTASDGWSSTDGTDYWYEDGVKQGTEGRGKEIYDPDSDAWYWLDAEQGGAKAVSKDVYQESYAGRYADRDDGTGKWVRYDDEGKMVKGWDSTDAGTYYFDLETGTMAKGYTTVDGQEYYFNTTTGILESEGHEVPEYGWTTIDGQEYWYEDCYREGYSLRESYRGKEIYDPDSDAWYWLDNVQGGAKAVSKDVYQESYSAYPDRADGTGKWVRYDENGHMVKGWQTTADGTYYFETITGAMAKGNVTIDGVEYYFDETTGILR